VAAKPSRGLRISGERVGRHTGSLGNKTARSRYSRALRSSFEWRSSRVHWFLRRSTYPAPPAPALGAPLLPPVVETPPLPPVVAPPPLPPVVLLWPLVPATA
jgi:hypothetical protein